MGTSSARCRRSAGTGLPGPWAVLTQPRRAGNLGRGPPPPPHSTLFLQVQVGDDDFIHIRVFESLPHENKPVALHDYQTDKSRQDELAYF